MPTRIHFSQEIDITGQALWSNDLDVWTPKNKLWESWAGPDGDNRNDGASERSPKKTAAAAYLSVQAGIVHVMEGCKWSDGTEATDGTVYQAGVNTSAGLGDSGGSTQGMYIVDTTHGASVWPGFVPSKFAHIIGHGASVRPFSLSPAALMTACPTGDRFHPGAWLLGNCSGLTIENIIINSQCCPWRLFVDLPRNSNGTLRGTAITAASRAAGVTTFTTTLQSYPVISATRVGTETRLLCSVPGDTKIPWSLGQQVRLVGSPSGTFPDGNKSFIFMVFGGVGTGTCLIIYQEGSGAVGVTDMTGASIRATGVMQGDRIEITSNDPEFPGTSYLVTAQSITNNTTGTITVLDPYGVAPRTAAVAGGAIGNYYQHDPINNGGTLEKLINCGGSMGGTQSADNLVTGPGCQIGGTAGGSWTYFDDCFWQGYLLDPPNDCLDPDYRGAAVYIDGGSYGPASGHFERIIMTSGGIKCYANAGGQLIVHEGLSDIAVGGLSEPTVDVMVKDAMNNSFGNFQVDCWKIDSADSGNQAGGCRADERLDANRLRAAFCVGVAGPWTRQSCTEIGIVRRSPWTERQIGTWNGGLVGFHPGMINAGAPRMVRVQNQIGASGVWAPSASMTLTAGQTDPYGGTNAVLVDISAAGQQLNLLNFVTVDQITGVGWTHSVGDRWAFAFFCKLVDGVNGSLPSGLMQSNPVGNLKWGKLSTLNTGFPHYGDGGWYLASGSGVLATANNTGPPSVLAAITVPSDFYIFEPWVIRSPAGAMTDDEWFEYMGTFIPSPKALEPGVIGTGLGQKFRAYGGLQTTGRLQPAKGTGSVASNKLTLDQGGNLFVLAGTPDIKYIVTTDWTAGSPVWLSLGNGAILRNNAGAVPASSAAIQLASGADLTVGANGQRVGLIFDGTSWVDF